MTVATPKVSVLVPAHDVEPWLDQCVESIVGQTWTDFEILLYDDGSKDGTGALCDSWAEKDSRVHVAHVDLCDISSMRNLLLSHAKGDYIAFIDADDFVEPEYLEYLVALLDEHPDKGTVACAHWIDDDGRLSIDAHADSEVTVFDRRQAYESLLYHGVVNCCCWAKMSRREVFESFSYPENSLYEDPFRIAELIDASEGIVFGSRVLYHYRKRRGSITAGGYKAYRLHFIDAVNHLIGRALACDPTLEKAAIRRRAHAYMSVLRTMGKVSGEDAAKRDELRDLALACADTVLKDDKAPIRDKLGLRTLALGYPAFFGSWHVYEGLRPFLAPIVGG